MLHVMRLLQFKIEQAFALFALCLAVLQTWPLAAEPAGPSAVVKAPSGLVLRERPDAASKSLGLLPTGAKVHITWFRPETVTIGGVEGRWLQVSFQGKTGWCFGGFLDALGGLDPSLGKRLTLGLWGPEFGWGMYTRFRADGTFHGEFQGEGAGEVLGLYSVVSADRIALKSIPRERGDDARPEGFDSECTFNRDQESVFKELYLGCGSVRHFDQSSIAPAGRRTAVRGVPVVTMGSLKAKTTTRVRVRSEPNTASKELECGGYGTPTVPYAEAETKLTVFARTDNKQTVQNWKNYWYYVDVQCFVLPVHGWVFGEFVKFE